MKNYTVSGVLRDLAGAINTKGNTIFVERAVGINSWGKLDFLKGHGYTVVTTF